MKKILGISLCALFAVSAANANIASTEYVNQKIDGMDAAATTGDYVKVVSQANGTVSATGASFAADVASGGTNAPTSSAVAAYVTSNAVNTVEEGTNNGTISVDGEDVAVKGLLGLAYKATVATNDIDANAVTSAKIADDAVTSAKIADDAVTSTQIVNETITDADISGTAAIATGKIAFTDVQKLALNSGINTGLVTKIGDNETKIGDLDADIQGMDADRTEGQYVKYVEQTDGKVTAAGESFDTSVTDESTSNNAPTTKAVVTYVQTKVQEATPAIDTGTENGTISVDGEDVAVKGLLGLAYKATVATNDIDANAVTSAKIADDAVTSAKIADDAVTSTQIVNETITDADISGTAAIATGKIAFTDAQKLALNSTIDRTKVDQIALNAGAITELKEDILDVSDVANASKTALTPTTECQDNADGCTLVYRNNAYSWEKITREAQ